MKSRSSLDLNKYCSLKTLMVDGFGRLWTKQQIYRFSDTIFTKILFLFEEKLIMYICLPSNLRIIYFWGQVGDSGTSVVISNYIELKYVCLCVWLFGTNYGIISWKYSSSITFHPLYIQRNYNSKRSCELFKILYKSISSNVFYKPLVNIEVLYYYTRPLIVQLR